MSLTDEELDRLADLVTDRVAKKLESRMPELLAAPGGELPSEPESGKRRKPGSSIRIPDDLKADWMTTREAMDALGIKHSALYQWIRDGLLEARKLGKYRLISRKGVERYVELSMR